jgi:hypothetical protein
MKPKLLPFDRAYLRWRGKFASFEATCFEALCDFVRVHFDDLLDEFYLEGHESLMDFPAWVFERYVQYVDRKNARDKAQ